MKYLKVAPFLLLAIVLNSCASSYQTIQPTTLDYNGKSFSDDVILEYRYDLLDKKYAKKEDRKDVRLVAVKITNNSKKDLVFGDDFKLGYTNGNPVRMLSNNETFKYLKQKPATHLLYLLLTPLNIFTTTSNGSEVETKTYPVGLAVGPGLAIGNLAVAATANKKFKTELKENRINGTVIESGKTAYGLIGIKSDSYGVIQPIYGDEPLKEETESISSEK